MGRVTYRAIPLNLCKEDFDDLHSTKDMRIVNEHGVILHKMSEAQSWQQWYREVIRAGLRTKLRDFEEVKRGFESCK